MKAISGIYQQVRNFCALGSQYSVSAIKGAIPIVHSGSACCLRIHKGMSFCNGYQGSGYGGGNGTPNDNIHRQDLIFGGEARIRELIEGTLKVMKAELYVVLTGCNVELAGDDTPAVVDSFRKKGIPIVCVPSAGFTGSAYIGHERLVKAIIRQLLDTGCPTGNGHVNLWMSVPYLDPFWSGNLEVVKGMLEGIGLEVNPLFGPSSSVENWRRIPGARFNLLISPWVGLETVELLKQSFGTPYLHYPALPIGACECSRFLRRVGEFAGLDMALVNRYIQQEEHGYYYYMERASELLTLYDDGYPERFHTVADSMYSLGIAGFLNNDLGFITGKQYITDNPPVKYRKQILEQLSAIMGGQALNACFTEDNDHVEKGIKEGMGDMKSFIIGSSWDAKTAKSLGGYFLGVSAPVSGRLILDRSYAGYRGGLRLTEDILSAVLNDYS